LATAARGSAAVADGRHQGGAAEQLTPGRGEREHALLALAIFPRDQHLRLRLGDGLANAA
jgi:hypothetical protein